MQSLEEELKGSLVVEVPLNLAGSIFRRSYDTVQESELESSSKNTPMMNARDLKSKSKCFQFFVRRGLIKLAHWFTFQTDSKTKF